MFNKEVDDKKSYKGNTGNMYNTGYKSNMGNKSNKGGKRIIILGVIGALIIIATVILFIRLSGNEKTDQNNSRAVDTADIIDDVSDKSFGDEQADSEGSGAAFGQAGESSDEYGDESNQGSELSDEADEKASASSENTADGLAADITVPPVVAAPVADKNDPQAEQSGGVKVDISKISSDDNKAEVITYGIDVAKWQGVIDWKQVKSSGVDFAMIRVGYRTLVDGTIYEDPYAEYNLQQAAANKIKIGVYFFSTAISKKEAIEEAKWVTELIAAYPITYPVVYNCEGFTNPNNRQYELSSDARTELAVAFLDYIKDQGYEPMFYAAKNELEQNAMWNTDKLSSKYKIWVAEYPTEKYTPDSRSTYTGKYAMWQYTNKGEVKGIKTAADINIAYFGYDKTAKPKKDTTREQVQADPYALISFKEVNETVTAKEKTNMRSVPSSADPDTIVAVLKNGDTAKRIGIGDNGWSKLEYDGKILYAVTSYLTTDLTAKAPTPTGAPQPAGISFKEVNEQVTAKDKTNLRSEPSTKSADTIVEVLKNGDVATRTGISDNGWSRVEYNGKTLYAVSSYLTTDFNYKEANTPTVENPEAGITFTAVNEQVTAKDVTNLRTVPSTASPDTVVVALHKGEIALRTGIGHNGWSRVKYDGQILYAVSSYLEVVENE